MKLVTVIVVAMVAGCHGQATLDPNSMVNSSVLYGNVASLNCNVSGTQTIVETLIFVKVASDGTSIALSSDNSPVNTTKHTITDKYTLNINDAVWTDEGEYRCQLGSGTTNTAYVTVGVAPTEGWIYWNDNSTWTQQDQAANLTCEASTARPPATFRWFRGTAQVTTGIISPASTVDANGYGTAVSMLEMTPTASDEGVEYTCFIDATGQDAAITKKLSVSFSGTEHVIASVSLVAVSVLFSSLRL